ncbi:MAG TPA: ABC transporter permease, partial [Burkholderiales bacterium]
MPVATLARSVLLEARRGGMPWLAAASVALGLGAAAFLSQVALTDAAALQLAVLAALLRACAVFLIAAQVSAATLREIQDKGLELMLSLPLSRTTHYLGRLAGFAACGVALAAVFAAALLPWASPLAALLWGVSLALEAAL